MISRDMKLYDYYTYGPDNGYGQGELSKEVQGSVKIAINSISEAISGNIKYKESSYIGLTYDKTITDTFVIQYGDEKLKVLYVNPRGRLRQVFLKEI